MINEGICAVGPAASACWPADEGGDDAGRSDRSARLRSGCVARTLLDPHAVKRRGPSSSSSQLAGGRRDDARVQKSRRENDPMPTDRSGNAETRVRQQRATPYSRAAHAVASRRCRALRMIWLSPLFQRMTGGSRCRRRGAGWQAAPRREPRSLGTGPRCRAGKGDARPGQRLRQTCCSKAS